MSDTTAQAVTEEQIDDHIHQHNLLRTEENRRVVRTKLERDASPQDSFRGDNAAMCASIMALLRLDAAGAVMPHGIGGHARTLLESAAARLTPTTGAVTDVQADEIANACYNELRKTDFSGGMGGLTWDRALVRAAIAQSSAQAQAELAELHRLRALINTPHTADWIKAVELEAAHQQERWGAEHDEGKAAQDWFWLLGYLSGKALASFIKGDREKGLHHIVSSGAVLLNWHRSVTGEHTSMRPGIADPDAAIFASVSPANSLAEGYVYVDNPPKLTPGQRFAPLNREENATHCHNCGWPKTYHNNGRCAAPPKAVGIFVDDQCRVNPEYVGLSQCLRGTMGCTVPEHRQFVSTGEHNGGDYDTRNGNGS